MRLGRCRKCTTWTKFLLHNTNASYKELGKELLASHIGNELQCYKKMYLSWLYVTLWLGYNLVCCTLWLLAHGCFICCIDCILYIQLRLKNLSAPSKLNTQWGKAFRFSIFKVAIIVPWALLMCHKLATYDLDSFWAGINGYLASSRIILPLLSLPFNFVNSGNH